MRCSSKHAMSVILPSVSSAQRMRTRVPGAAASGEPESSACSSAVSAPSSVHERPRERAVERMVAQRFGDPRRRRHDPGLARPRPFAGRVARVGVVLERRDEHAARGGADAEHAPVPEAAEERADDGPDAAPVREFELPGRSHRLGSPTGAPAPRQTATSVAASCDHGWPPPLMWRGLEHRRSHRTHRGRRPRSGGAHRRRPNRDLRRARRACEPARAPPGRARRRAAATTSASTASTASSSSRRSSPRTSCAPSRSTSTTGTSRPSCATSSTTPTSSRWCTTRGTRRGSPRCATRSRCCVTSIAIDDGSGTDCTAIGSVPLRRRARRPRRPTRDFEPRSDDDIYILYTGGTTGMPKGVVWRQEDVIRVLGGGIAFDTGEKIADEYRFSRGRGRERPTKVAAS